MTDEAVGTEAGVVTAYVDNGRGPARAALHSEPPDITGRISTTDASATVVSPVTRVPSTMTSTDSLLSSSRSRRRDTTTGPSTSSSRRGLRRRTFTGQL